jgi:hypothetical protein
VQQPTFLALADLIRDDRRATPFIANPTTQAGFDRFAPVTKFLPGLRPALAHVAGQHADQLTGMGEQPSVEILPGGAPPLLLAFLEIPLKYHDREEDPQRLQEEVPQQVPPEDVKKWNKSRMLGWYV